MLHHAFGGCVFGCPWFVVICNICHPVSSIRHFQRFHQMNLFYHLLQMKVFRCQSVLFFQNRSKWLLHPLHERKQNYCSFVAVVLVSFHDPRSLSALAFCSVWRVLKPVHLSLAVYTSDFAKFQCSMNLNRTVQILQLQYLFIWFENANDNFLNCLLSCLLILSCFSLHFF